MLLRQEPRPNLRWVRFHLRLNTEFTLVSFGGFFPSTAGPAVATDWFPGSAFVLILHVVEVGSGIVVVCVVTLVVIGVATLRRIEPYSKD